MCTKIRWANSLLLGAGIIERKGVGWGIRAESRGSRSSLLSEGFAAKDQKKSVKSGEKYRKKPFLYEIGLIIEEEKTGLSAIGNREPTEGKSRGSKFRSTPTPVGMGGAE